MNLNRPLQRIIILCVSAIFVVSSMMHMHDLIMADAALYSYNVYWILQHILFACIDLLMALWLMYNIKRHIEPTVFVGLMTVHSIASMRHYNTMLFN